MTVDVTGGDRAVDLVEEGYDLAVRTVRPVESTTLILRNLLTPSFLVEEDMQTGRLVEILPAWRPLEFAINALYPHRHQLSSKVRIFIDLMAEHFSRHSRWLDLTAMS